MSPDKTNTIVPKDDKDAVVEEGRNYILIDGPSKQEMAASLTGTMFFRGIGFPNEVRFTLADDVGSVEIELTSLERIYDIDADEWRFRGIHRIIPKRSMGSGVDEILRFEVSGHFSSRDRKGSARFSELIAADVI